MKPLRCEFGQRRRSHEDDRALELTRYIERTALAACLVGIATGGLGCTGPDWGSVDTAAAPDVGTLQRFAVITLTYSAGQSRRIRDELVGQAVFVEHGVGSREALLGVLSDPHASAAVGSIIAKPGPWVDAANGDGAAAACVMEQRDLLAEIDGEHDHANGRVRLLDAGEVMLESPARATMLSPSYFPALDSRIGGLTYAGAVQNTAAFSFRQAMTVTADGSDEVGGFSVSVLPPQPIHIRTVDDREIVAARTRLTPGALNDGLQVTWNRPRRGRGQRQAVVTWVRRGFDRAATLSCVVDDVGSFRLPAPLLAALPNLGVDQADQLSVQRVIAAPFSALNMSDGLVVAISRDAVFLD